MSYTGTELRVFYAGGYASHDVAPETALSAAEQARFEYGRTRRLVLIQWEPTLPNGDAFAVWRWDAEGRI